MEQNSNDRIGKYTADDTLRLDLNDALRYCTTHHLYDYTEEEQAELIALHRKLGGHPRDTVREWISSK